MKARKIHAFLTAAAIFVLVWIGGLVTSHGAGMAVPDWPNTFGYNMFFFPVSKWIGGIFYEHTHRLAAAGVGLLVAILALWLFGYRARPLVKWGGAALAGAGVLGVFVFPAFRIEGALTIWAGAVAFGAGFNWPACGPAPGWLKKAGVAAFALVVAQGLLGGFRVTQMNDQLGIIHATLAQVFFALAAAICMFLTDYWRNLPGGEGDEEEEGDEPAETRKTQRWKDDGFIGDRLSKIKVWCGALSLLILLQLVLGATMRHQHAGLAIPDFPAAYGKIWPATDDRAIESYNQSRIEAEGCEPITAFQVWLQMAHRIAAYAIVILVLATLRRAWRELGWGNDLTRWALAWAVLVAGQGVLGATTIWTEKSADIATLHVACGALCLVTGVMMWLVARKVSRAVDVSRSGVNRARKPTLTFNVVVADFVQNGRSVS